MKSSRLFFGMSILLLFFASSLQAGDLWGDLKSGAFSPGFKLVLAHDAGRFYPPAGNGGRPVRLYIWYPTPKSEADPMLFSDFLRLASEDFRGSGLSDSRSASGAVLTVQLSKGIDPGRLEGLIRTETASVRNAPAARGPFPLLVLGQGLYYESPVTHLILCEYLASRGYVVVTSPLMGTRCRLVNINIEDVETQVRDMEFALSQTRRLPYVDANSLGVIGYDLGGMSAILLCMRHPEVKAFLSLDSGILLPHPSGLPASHPLYNEQAFRIPWMHITQSRIIDAFRDQQKIVPLSRRKSYGDSYLGYARTTNHGGFTSYALYGISRPVPGYWGPVEDDPALLYREICRLVPRFFDRYLRSDKEALSGLPLKQGEGISPDTLLAFDVYRGKAAPPVKDELIDLIITKGLAAARPVIDEARKAYSASELCDEGVVNWLGYHFLYWWGREAEAVEVFRLNTSLFPESANAYDSLGEAYVTLGKTEHAIQCYEKSLKLNPDNEAAKRILQRLKK